MNSQMQSQKRRKNDSRSASKPTTPLNRLRGAVGEKKNWGAMRSALDSVKNDGPAQNFERLYKISMLSPIQDVAIPSAKPIKKHGRLQSVLPLDAASIHKEIRWAATIIKSNAALINKFVKIRQEFITSLLTGDLVRAETLLDESDKSCGLSLWAIENRIAIKAVAGGFESPKIYIGSIVEEGRRTFAGFFASNIGERNESRVSKASYESRLREKIKSWKLSSDHEAYVLYKLIGNPPRTLIQACEILSFEASSSPLDLYDTLIDILSWLKDISGTSEKEVLSAINSLAGIQDPCLSNLSTLYSQAVGAEIEVDPSEHIDAFLQGNYEGAAELTYQRLRAHPDDFTSILVAARLLAMGHNCDIVSEGLNAKIITLMGDYLAQESENNEAAQALERIALNFRCLPISASINALLDEISTSVLGDIAVASAVRASSLPLPVLLSLLGPTQGTQFLEANESSTPAFLYEGLARGSKKHEPVLIGLSPEAIGFATVTHCKSTGDFSRGLEEISRIEKSANVYMQQEATILRAWFNLDEGNIFDALLHTVRTAIKKPTLLRSLPLTRIIENRGFRDLKQLERDICLSIGFFLYISQTRENTKDVALKVAWKQFHKAHGVAKPSELPHLKAAFEPNQLLFFLRYVCTQEIMELSSEFNSPADLEKERLLICIALSELDPEHATEYNSEIIELTRRLSIEDGVQQVESSRVYVDLLGLQRWCHQNLNELFLRYLDYMGAGLEASGEALERSLLALLRKSGFEAEVVNFLDGYDISADSLLAELIEAVATAFLTLPRFGLDAFLGSRVRHGSLEGGFRSPLEARRLITKIDSSSNQYETNIHWLNDVEFKSKEQRNAIDKVLNNFSKSIDSLIDGAISRFVYVRTIHNNEGLITLWPTDELKKRNLLKYWLIQTKLNLSPTATIEQFVEFCTTTFFWPTLKQSLSEAAEYVTETLAGEVRAELERLSTEIQNITKQLPLLIATIDAAKGDIEQAALKVSKWFSPPQFTNAGSTYLLKTGIEIGITSLRHLHPRFEPAVQWVVTERANVLLHPTAFQIINDVSFLIFGNIIKHSGYFEGSRSDGVAPAVQISIGWSDPGFVEVEVRSAIAEDKNIGSIEENVATALKQIELGQFDTVAKKKNKTGLVRLASTLNYERADDKTLEFGVVDNRTFRVFFSVPEFFLTGKSQ
ncbi:hypothetical protein V9L20_02590 [Variovorax sp. CCNWLW225]|uniref:hypothetical protein n=1 Tax=Variovorax sp. CCNWLW225 TaxID=3127462 RepID=UPI0030773077